MTIKECPLVCHGLLMKVRIGYGDARVYKKVPKQLLSLSQASNRVITQIDALWFALGKLLA